MSFRISTLSFVLVCLACAPAPAISEDLASELASESDRPARVVVVTANRTEMPIEQVASSMSVVPGREIEEKQITHVSEALRNLPGVDVVRSGPVGGNTAVFIRGANSEHTLVLIDGVEANDPISPTRSFNFADLDSENIEQIEVLRGPQSTLYGSDAMGGVINIITKKGDGTPHAFASAEAGSYNTYTEKAGLSGSEKQVDFSFGMTQENSHSISAADEKFGNTEKDSYKNTGFSGRLGYQPLEQLQFKLTSRYNHSDAKLDNGGGPGADDPNRMLKHEESFSRFEAGTSFFDGKLKQTFGVGYADQWFTDNNDVDAQSSEMLRSRYDGKLLKFDWQNNVAVTEWFNFIFGAETERERGSSQYYSEGPFGPYNGDFDPQSARTNGYFAQGHFNAGQFFGTTGIRVDDHSEFGSEVSWKVAPGYQIDSTGTRLTGSVGTGFKAPSLYQLYSSFGNPDLKPEKSLGVDGGIEQQIIGDKLAAGVTYFWNDFDDLITFDPNTFISENIARARTQGLETSLSARPLKQVTTKLSYTYLRARDLDTGEQLLRRPKSKFASDTTYQFSAKGNVILSVLVVGQSVDNDFSTYPASRINLPSYTTVNVATNYEIHKNVELFARVDNLFDRDYEEVYGYGTRGAAAYGGIKLKL
ncbi:MAG: TonB-dependent receptor [Deltaproteobacteria bacterium]|nr:TonB-dependent receptor [Deltaproteobacteria bacterium]